MIYSTVFSLKSVFFFFKWTKKVTVTVHGAYNHLDKTGVLRRNGKILDMQPQGKNTRESVQFKHTLHAHTHTETVSVKHTIHTHLILLHSHIAENKYTSFHLFL